MAKIEVTLPAMGEGIIEATITKWFVREGDTIDEDEALLEVATDKVDSEIPSPVSGVISRIFYPEGEIPKIGAVIAVIENDQDSVENIQDESDSKEAAAYENPISSKIEFKDAVDKESGELTRVIESSLNTEKERLGILLTPFIRFMAKNREITYEELVHIKGTGLNGRVTKEDLNAYIRDGRPFQKMINREQQQLLKVKEEEQAEEKPEYIAGPGEELVEMDRTRKLIAEHMVRSKRISPHVTSMVEIDVTSMVQWRDAHKEEFFKKHGVKLTYTPLIAEAAVKALKKFPGINISVSGDYIIRKKNINIGVATALPNGNLIVPVIKDADQRTFVNLARELADLASRARTGKLEPAEIKSGTFTITNMGQYDNISGTPIINQPEVAILAVGAIKKKPGVVVVNGVQSVGIRDIMVLSLTYDHRVVDGALGGSFVKEIGLNLEGDMPEI